MPLSSYIPTFASSNGPSKGGPKRTDKKLPITEWLHKERIIPLTNVLIANKKTLSWYLNNGCSHHKRSIFQDLNSEEISIAR